MKIALLFALLCASVGIALLNHELGLTKDVNIYSGGEIENISIEAKDDVNLPHKYENSNIDQTSKATNLESVVETKHLYFESVSLQEMVDSYFSSQANIHNTDQILEKVDLLERSKEIIPIEALSLRLALLKTTAEEFEYPDLAEKLTQEYQDKISAEAPEIDDEKNANYKQREREVLLEVQAMSEYPDGMSQSEYLRHRLQLLRTEVFD